MSEGIEDILFNQFSFDISCFGQEKLKVQIFDCGQPNAPIVYLHEIGEEKDSLLSLFKNYNIPSFSLVLIQVPEKLWNEILSPWPTPKKFPKYLKCQGKAEEYLPILLYQIIPKVHELIPTFGDQVLIGYSLAGLFSLWAACKCNTFKGIGAVSGSFWYPNFEEWFFKHLPSPLPITVYFSSSVKECQSKNPYLAPLQPTIEKIEKYLSEQGVRTIFEINEGNHFQNPTQRLMIGLIWTLTHF